MPGIGIITNPHSKLNRRHPERQKLLGYIVGEHGKLELTNTLDDLTKAAERFRDRSIEVLGINGGDGTISRTMTAIVRAYGTTPLPKVLILRGGTINVLAENLGLRGTPEAILVRYIESLSGICPVKLESYRLLSIDGHYGFLFGNGMVANYLEEFYKRKTGPIGAVLLVLKIYFWFFVRRNRFNQLVGEQQYELSYRDQITKKEVVLPEKRSLAVMASTLERMPLGPKFFPLARSKSNCFQFFSLNIPASAIVWRLPFAFLRNREGRFFGKISFLTSHLKSNTAGGTPQKYTLDGELFTSHNGKLEISLGPLAQFIVV